MLRCWCPDRTLAQARKYIADVMGTRYAEGVILDLEAMWAESTPRTPLICFLSMGSDPTNNIEALAKKLRLECHAISMGQGQEVHARRLLQQSMTTVRNSSNYCTYTCVSLHVVLHRVHGFCCRTATWGWTSWTNYWTQLWRQRTSTKPLVYG